MKLKILQLIMLTALLPVSLFAQRNDIPARIALKEQSGVAEVLLTGRRGDTIYARLNSEATGSITYEARDIKHISVSLSADELRQAEVAASAGQTQDVLRLMRAAVRPVLPFLDLPIDGAHEAALQYAKVLRSEKLWAEAATVYKAMNGNTDEAISQQAAGWLAYCYAKNLQPKEAREWIDSHVDVDPRNPGFVPAMLAESILLAGEGKDEAALDLAARASSLARIDNELYPEAVFLSADAYYRMSKKVVDKPKHAEVVLSKGDKVESPTPAMLPEEFLAVATNQFYRVAHFFPSSMYAGQATNKLADIQKELDAAQPPITPNPEINHE